MTVGDRIKYYREKKNMTQEDLAKVLDTTPQNVYKYEKGIIQNIPFENLKVLAELFNVPPYVLIGWDEEEDLFETSHMENNSITDFDVTTMTDLEKNIIVNFRQKPQTNQFILNMLGINDDECEDGRFLRVASPVMTFDEDGNIVLA